MSDLITVQGVVISAMPIGEYDKRIVLLTRERGKISAFAKGARRPNSPFLAAADPFVFGTFTLFEGRSSYNLNQVSVSHHFVELADYFGREGTDEREMMNLLYVTVKALLNPKMDNRLIRCIFELRTMVEEGLCPELFQCAQCGREEIPEGQVFFSQDLHGILCQKCASGQKGTLRISPSALYAMRFIATAPMGKLYTFTVKDEVLLELEHIIHRYTAANTDKRFRSLQILEVMK